MTSCPIWRVISYVNNVYKRTPPLNRTNWSSDLRNYHLWSWSDGENSPNALQCPVPITEAHSIL